MGIEDIITRGKAREAHLWQPFSHDLFGFPAVVQRAILFGLYANGFSHGFAYLTEISEEKLVQLVDQFDVSMAQLNAEEQQVVMDIATKQYLDLLDTQIHDQKMITKQAEIDATDAEFDAKFAALEQDRLAIETKREQLAQAISKAETEIQILEARIAEAEIDREYVEVEISSKQLDVVRTRLKILEAGNRGLGLQYDIVNAAVQKADLLLDKQQTQQKLDLIPGELAEIEAADKNLDADIVHSETNKAMVDVDIAEIQVRAARTNLDVTDKEIDTALVDVDIAKAKLDTAMVDVEIEETKAKTAREEAKQIELQTDTALVDVAIAQAQLDADKVAAQLKEIEADIALLNAKKMRDALISIEKQIIETRKNNLLFEIPTKKQIQLDTIQKQLDILEDKIDAEEELQKLEEQTYLSQLDKQDLSHAYRMAIAKLDKEYALHRADIKINSYSKDLELIKFEELNQSKIDLETIKVPRSQIIAAIDAKRAAVEAAKTMAIADITNKLVHSIKGT